MFFSLLLIVPIRKLKAGANVSLTLFLRTTDFWWFKKTGVVWFGAISRELPMLSE